MKIKITNRTRGIESHEFVIGGIGSVVKELDGGYLTVGIDGETWVVYPEEYEIVNDDEEVTAVTRPESEYCE